MPLSNGSGNAHLPTKRPIYRHDDIQYTFRFSESDRSIQIKAICYRSKALLARRLTPRKTKCDGGIERQEKDKRIRHKVTRDPSIAGAAVCLAKLHKHPLPFILIRAKHNRGKDPAWPGHDFNRQRTEPPRDRLQGIADCGHRDPRFGQQVGSCRRSAESSSLQPGPSSPDFSQRVDASGL
jgi:hypothetical protein